MLAAEASQTAAPHLQGAWQQTPLRLVPAQPTLLFRHRRILVAAAHMLLWTLSFCGAFALRFDFQPAAMAGYFSWSWLLILLIIRTGVAWYTGGFHGLWRYSGVRDLQTLLIGTSASSAIFMATLLLLVTNGFPRSILVIDWAGTIILVGGLRFATRTLRELSIQAADTDHSGRRLLIVGAGSSGEMLLREIRRHASRYVPIGFVDDDRNKHQGRIHGVPVLGSISDVPRIVAAHQVEEIIVAIPTANGRQMRRMIGQCQPAGVPVRTIPSIDQLIDGRVTINQVRDVAIEDLLGRAPVVLDPWAVSHFLHHKCVLVTGAGGSIGSELCRQIRRFKPDRLIIVEQAENALFDIERELHSKGFVQCIGYIADVLDEARMTQIFQDEKPMVVLHAAAHKHVPMMERHPGEAIKNNIMASRLLANLADAHGVENFVLVSSDKAVNPTSVMGASKRAAEMYVQAMAQRSRTRFSIVRFGNVLGSAGSVIPLFKEQIAKGGPVTVTHPDMRRFFMTIPEACQLVLQAGAMGQGGDLFVLDMGEPVRIVDLARDLIALCGLVPGDDIEIRFTGIRPGEKLAEELNVSHEALDPTTHPKILVGRASSMPWIELNERLLALAAYAARETDADALRCAMKELIPEFTPHEVHHAHVNHYTELVSHA